MQGGAVHICIVHLLRHSIDFTSYKDRKPVAAALKEIYRASDASAAEKALAERKAFHHRATYDTEFIGSAILPIGMRGPR